MGIPNKLSPLTGGGSILPRGYLPAEFLENPTPRDALTVAYFALQTEPISHEDVVDYETEHFFPLEPSNNFMEGLATPEKAETMGEVEMFGASFGWGWRQTDKGYVFSEGLDNHPTQPGTYWGDVLLSYSPVAPVAKWFKNTVKFTPDGFSANVDGVQVAGFTGAVWHKNLPPRIETGVFGLLNYLPTAYANRPLYGRKKSYTVIKNGKIINKLVPCVAVDGEVTFFDIVTKKTVPRVGAEFIAGFTLAQALNLRKLPVIEAGTLTVSLPWEAQLVGSGVPAALTAATAKGWTITVQYRDPEPDSAVYNKYAQCETYDDVINVNPSYMYDANADGEWVYPLPKLKSTSKSNLVGLFSDYYGEYRNSPLRVFKLTLPELTSCNHFLYENNTIEEVELNLPKITNVERLLGGSKCKKAKLNIPLAKSVSFGTVGNQPRFKELEVYWPVVETVGNLGYCELGKNSALQVLEALPNWSTGTHTAVIGLHVDLKTDEDVVNAIAEAEAKGWTLTVRWNGTATAAASTFAMRQPVFAKLGEPNEDGSPHIVWGHYVTNWEENGYQEFASLEEAQEYFNIEE